ncbi:MAG TPA: MFS transporter [Pseudonocardiaceae bacterium]|nr:MFS transporter [Pseudonocardiaceae bacterium]
MPAAPDDPLDLDAPAWARVRLRSVGVDVGSATSHLVFSEITMAKVDQRFVPVAREVTYSSPILLTPYAGGSAIDVPALLRFIDDQFAAAGLAKADIGCGAVILTGTALDRVNARLAADLSADHAGRFVAVSAGDALEAVLAAHGSGAVARSARSGGPVVNLDIGGGTAKLALCVGGVVAATAALDAGARLVVVDDAGRVVRVEPAGVRIAKRLGVSLVLGRPLARGTRDAMARHLVGEIVTALRGGDSWLLRTPPLTGTADTVVVSGGVAEYLTGEPTEALGDLGPAIGTHLRSTVDIELARDPIRATVFGAALFTVQLSGDTIHVSRPDALPLRDVPVVVLDQVPDAVSATDVAADVVRALDRNGRRGTTAAVALAVRWTGSATLPRLTATAHGIADGLGSAGAAGPVVLVCDEDVGRLLGRHLTDWLPHRDVVAVDGVDVRDFDFLDVADQNSRGTAVPVTVKSLVFGQDAEPEPAKPTGGTFSSLRVFNYRLYFFGQGISVAGNWMQNVAIAWLVLQLTDNAVILGAVTAARFVPLVLLGPLGGLVTDRSDKRRLLTATQFALGSLALLLAVLAWLHAVSLVVLLVIVVALGLVNAFDGPARQSLISNLVGRDRLANAVALNSVALNSSRIIGPAIGGGLIATLGIAPCFFVNALSFVAVIASLLAMRTAELYPSLRETRSPGQIRAGVRYVARTHTVLAPLMMVTVAGIFAWEFPVSLPLVVVDTFHTNAAAYGVVMSCLGAGSIAGGLVAARRGSHSVRSLAVSSVAWGALIVLAALSPSMPVLYAAIALVGSGAITFNSAAKTLLQLSADPVMRGRVMSLWSIAWQGTSVVGAPIVGVVAAVLGARYGLAIGGVTTVLAGVYFLVGRPARDRHGVVIQSHGQTVGT